MMSTPRPQKLPASESNSNANRVRIFDTTSAQVRGSGCAGSGCAGVRVRGVTGCAGSDRVLQPIMPLDLPVKVRSWELTVYPRSDIRRWLGVTRPAKART